ncbi:phage tail tape measure protein [Oscillospiraceae bacterium NTUH-002-81]|nr:phage tail tape measure protein [Oscillospiraceae bacterium NTUH-002-81]
MTDEIADRDALYQYFDKAIDKAKELNVKVDSLLYAITEFKKMGWSLQDAELGGQWATILENVGDVDIDSAIGSIKSSIASFEKIGGYGNDQMDKKLEAYTDLVNEMSNKYSIDAEGLAEAIRISAGTLTQAHTSIEQAATMFATANRYYNDPNYLGNTAKIGSLRLRASEDADAKNELQQLGEDIDDVAQSASKLREKLLKLTNVDIMEADGKTFKSFYDQLYEISQVMDRLSDVDRANVLETIFGKARAAGGAALLSGMKESAEAYETAMNSAGSATKEYETWMTSADAAQQRFSNSVTETYQNIVNGNTVRDMANLGASVLDFANSWGLVEGSLKGVLALGLGKFLVTGTTAFLAATKQVESYGKALQAANNIPNENLNQRFQFLKSIALETGNLTNAQLKNVLASQALSQQDRIRILEMQGMTREMALQRLNELGLTQSTNAQTAANAAQTASTFSLKAAMIGLGNTIRSVFLSNPVGIALMAISIGVSAVTSAVSKHNQKIEEMRQNAKEAAEEASTLGNEVSELANKYLQLSEAVKTDSSVKEDLMSTQSELLKKLGAEGESVDSLIEKYGSLSEAVKQMSLDSLKEAQIDLLAGVDASKEELKDAGKDSFGGAWKQSIIAMGKEAAKAWQVLDDAGIISSGTHTDRGGEWFLSGDSSVEGVLQNYKEIEAALEALRDSHAFTAEELSNNTLYKELYSRYSDLKESVDGYNSSITNLNQNLAQQTTLTALQGNTIPNTEKDFDAFRQELINTAIASKQFIGDEQAITDAINQFLSTLPEFEGFYSTPLQNELDKTGEVLSKWDYATTLSNLDKTKDAFEALDSAYAKLFDNDKITGIDFDDLTTINEKFSDVSGIDTYIKRIQEAGQNTEQVRGIFEDLIDAYIQQTGILENVTEDNKDLIASYLEEMGVANALELVENALAWQTDALAAEKEFAAEKGIELVNATADEINAFVDEKGYSEQTRHELLLLALQKEYVNQTALDFSGDLTSLMSYMTALGSATTALQMFNNAKNGTGSYSGKYVNTAAMSQLKSAASSEVEKAISNAKSQISKSKGSSYNPNKSSYKGGSSTGKNKSGSSGNKGVSGSGSKAQEDTYEKEIDWYEKRVKKLDALINTLKADIENVLGSVAKNQLVERQLTITEEKIKNTSDALSMYEQKAAEALSKVPSEFRDKVMNGAVALTDFIGKGNEDTVEAIENYQTWADKVADVKQNLSELKETMRELELEKFNNIIEEFTNKFDIHDQAINNIDKQISLFEEMGLHIGEGFYNAQISEATKQLEHLQQEKEALVKQMNESVDSGRIDAGSDQWLEMVKELSDLDGNILDCKTDIEKFNNSIQQVHWDNLDELSDRLSGIKSELENIASLLEDEDVIDDNGNWTVEAITRLGLAAQQYEEAEYRVKKYSDEIDGLNKAYLEGKYSADEYAEKLQELKNAQWDAVNDSESAKDAIISINEERIDALEEMKQKEIDAMQEVIDKRKEELDAEKDLADYREQLAEKTKSVTDLDRQIAAMSGDTTASTVAKRKKLEAQRAEAQKNLDDFNRDHAIDAQKEALDKQLEDFTNEKNAEIEALKATLDDKNALYQQSFELVKANASTIADELDKLSAAHGVTISKNITDPWKAGQNAIAGYGVTLTTQTSVFTGCLDIINTEIQKDQSSADELSKKIGEAFAQKIG